MEFSLQKIRVPLRVVHTLKKLTISIWRLVVLINLLASLSEKSCSIPSGLRGTSKDNC